MSVNNGNDVYNNGLTDADVKDIVDNLPEFNEKADANKTVALYDGYIRRLSQSVGWAKIASKKFDDTNRNVNSLFRLYGIGSIASNTILGTLILNVRFGSSGSTPTLVKNQIEVSRSIFISSKIKVIGNSGNATIEIWVQIPQFILLFYTCIGNGKDIEPLFKDWNFFRSITPEDAPVADPDNNIYVFDSVRKINQYSIENPTKDNIVSMDENGLVIDSGINIGVFTDDNGDQMTETPPQQVYVVGKFYFVNGKICRCTAYSASSATFDVYGVVEAMNYILSQV